MKTLLVCYTYLHGFGGGSFATKAYINAFASLSDKSTLLYKEKPGSVPAELDSGIELIPVHDTRPKALKFASLLSGQVHPFRKRFKKLLASGEYDTVVFTSSISSFGLIDFAHNKGCKVYTIHHNCEYDYYKDNSTGLLSRIILFWTLRFESQALAKSDKNLLLTDNDAEAMSRRYGIQNLPYSRLGVFEYKKQPLPEIGSRESSERFVITGGLADRQTFVSISKWIRTYYPILKSTIPDSKLTVAGKDPSRELTDVLEAAGCRLIPSPASMAEILLDADYYLNPVDLGSGLKLRNMDGLRYGMPVISHEVSARGYEDFLGKALFCYSDADSFQKALDDAGNIEMSASEIQTLYYSVFSFDAGCARLADILSAELK